MLAASLCSQLGLPKHLQHSVRNIVGDTVLAEAVQTQNIAKRFCNIVQATSDVSVRPR